MIEVNEDSITVKRCHSSHCQVCARPYDPLEIVYFMPLDDNLVCKNCAVESGIDFEPRIYFNEQSLALDKTSKREYMDKL